MKMYVDCSNTSHIEYIFIDYIIMIMIVAFIIICKKVHRVLFDSFPYGAIV